MCKNYSCIIFVQTKENSIWSNFAEKKIYNAREQLIKTVQCRCSLYSMLRVRDNNNTMRKKSTYICVYARNNIQYTICRQI